MKIVKDVKPRYKVLGVKSLKGTSFSSAADAKLEGERHLIMRFLWERGVTNQTRLSVYEIALILHKDLDKLLALRAAK
jgi:hypothetical protein